MKRKKKYSADSEMLAILDEFLLMALQEKPKEVRRRKRRQVISDGPLWQDFEMDEDILDEEDVGSP